MKLRNTLQFLINRKLLPPTANETPLQAGPGLLLAPTRLFSQGLSRLIQIANW
jgi:hypothetical protein